MRGVLLLLVFSVAADKPQVVNGTSGARSDCLDLQAGGLVVREGEVGSAFGTYQLPKGKRQLTYFVLVKHRLAAGNPLTWVDETTARDDGGSSKSTLTQEDRTLQLDYQLTLESTKKVGREALVVNGKPVDLSRGRVLLVDLTVSPPRVEQRKVDLPAEVASAATKRAAEELARQVIAALEKKDRKCKEFVEAATR